ncbi:MAG: flagellar protein FliT [Woeseiaceae bacterium]
MAEIAAAQDQSLHADITSTNQQIEELAVAGDWEAVSDLIAKRNAMLRDLDDDQKEDVLRMTIRSTARIRALVEKAKDDIGKELGQLQRGREATASYSANT